MADERYAAVVYSDACTELAERIARLIESEANGIDERLRAAFIAGALTRAAAVFDDHSFTADGVGGAMLEVLDAVARQPPPSRDD